MTILTIKRWLRACIIAAVCVSPVAQAELDFFEKIKAERAAERVAAEQQPVLTQIEVDRLVQAIPLFQNTLEQLDLPELSDEQSKKMSLASMSGNPTTTMAALLKGTGALVTLEKLATETGFENYNHYAGHFDIAYGVLSSGNWISMARNMVRDGEEKPEPIDNLWEYILDESKPAAEREKLSTQLDEMLPRFGTNRKNAEIVYRNFDALKPLVIPPRKK